MPDLSAGEMALGLAGSGLVGNFLPQVWKTLTGRRIEKLSEAEIIAKLSAAFREEVRLENNELRGRMDKVVGALTKLTDTLDDVFPKIEGLTQEERTRLRQANNNAKRAT